jgi:hypothetical protein
MLLDAASRNAVHPLPPAEGDLGTRNDDINAEVHLPHPERDEREWVEAVVHVGLVGRHVRAVDGSRIDDDGVPSVKKGYWICSSTSGGLVILLRAEEEVDLALGLEVNHERAEVVMALHLTLTEERDRLAQPVEARTHGRVVGGHDHGVGAASLEELLDHALAALPRSMVVVGYLIPHLVLDVIGGPHGNRQSGHVGRDGDGGDGQVDGDGEAKRGRSDRVVNLPFMATTERRHVRDEPQQVGPGGGKTATDKWAPAKSFLKRK